MNKTMLTILIAGWGVLATPAAADPFSFSDSSGFTAAQGWNFNSPNAGSFMGELNNNLNVASVTLAVASPGASAANGANLSFNLLGFRTLDGNNGFNDDFSLTINGALVFQGTFGLGGGGGDVVTVDTNGATFSHVGSLNGDSDSLLVQVPFSLLTGPNTLQFAYDALQSFGDEAWGLDNVAIAADVTILQNGVLPEPGSLALLGLGLAGLGLRRRIRASR